ncbi:unnamed protein product [Ilex paraguariensis]|uniref:Uncharacterized protein n=1 Tax=Ilex paraguariensis TaxID=185542 RepID=A0ABC8S5T6_9AQUA
MAGATARIPTRHRILTWGNVEIGNSRDPVMNLSSTVFGFLEEEGQGSLESISSDDYGDNDVMEYNEERENSASVGDKKSFWETQHQLLQATLRRTSSLETRIRNATKEAIKEFQLAENVCICLRPVATGCRNCLMREVCSRLQNAGINSAICKSKWSSSPDIPSGKHTFLDVVDSSNSKKTEPIRVIIELNFRAEFEMARANEEYNQLINMLPEILLEKSKDYHP